MSYDLHIFSNATPNPMDDEVDEYAPLGSRKHVVEVIDRFFPEMTWLSAYEGECDCEEGLVEFKIAGDPVEVVRVFLHGADAVPMLARMSQQNGWWIFDDSSGEAIDLPRIVESGTPTTVASRVDNSHLSSRVKLPRIKEKLRGDDERFRAEEDGHFIVQLRDDESTYDLWKEYGRFLDDTDLRKFPWACCGITANSEIVVPDGRRFAELLFFRWSPDSNKVLDQFSLQTNRKFGVIRPGVATLPDGQSVPLSECEIHFRALPRKAAPE